MKYCQHCGKELLDAAVICPGCGCQCTPPTAPFSVSPLNKLSSRLTVNGIIWLAIGITQIFLSLFVYWEPILVLLVVGIVNIVAGIGDMRLSKRILTNPIGIVNIFEKLTRPIIALIYNLLIGAIFGVIGSIYYFVGIRAFVMENKEYFLKLEADETAANLKEANS